MTAAPTGGEAGAPLDCDVAVVGQGPVGQVLALLLARQGHRVTIVERRPQPYPRPRAVHFDDEAAGILHRLGLGPGLAGISEPADGYDWRNAAGDVLLRFDRTGVGPSGRPVANMFCQVELERLLAAEVAAAPGITVLAGYAATALDDRGDHAELRVQDAESDGTRILRAGYVVGCDGANSFVRDRLGTTVTDLGFHDDWLIVDVVPHEPRPWHPTNLQVCDPARPSTAVSGGPGRRRWEFMRLPEETVEDLNTEETAWRLLAPWGVTPDNADLERHTVYTFQARWADRWRAGRMLIAGDAAHLMPPFAGQGMCSGLRDAANLAWKLDLVLTGRTADTLLDTYTSERTAHVRNAIGISVELGNVICLTDAETAAGRDEYLLAAGTDPATALPPVPPAVLGPGVLQVDAAGAPIGAAGQFAAQARVTDQDGRTALFDELVGSAFAVVTTADLGDDVLTGELCTLLARIGARVVRFAAPGDSPAVAAPIEVFADTEGFYLPHLKAVGAEVAVLRPDHYVFGTAASAAGLPGLLVDLAVGLALLPDGPAAPP